MASGPGTTLPVPTSAGSEASTGPAGVATTTVAAKRGPSGPGPASTSPRASTSAVAPTTSGPSPTTTTTIAKQTWVDDFTGHGTGPANSMDGTHGIAGSWGFPESEWEYGSVAGADGLITTDPGASDPSKRAVMGTVLARIDATLTVTARRVSPSDEIAVEARNYDLTAGTSLVRCSLTGSTLRLIAVGSSGSTVLGTTPVSVPPGDINLSIDAEGADFTCRLGTATVTGHTASYPNGQFSLSAVGHVVVIRTLEEFV
jgi:hypothetical protein